MTHSLRTLFVTIGLGVATCAAQSAPIGWPAEPGLNEPAEQPARQDERRAEAPGWQGGGGGWNNAPQDDDDAANDTAVENEARQTDAELTTDYPAAAEPFEQPSDVPYDEQEDN